ncbi:MAG: Gx transporter family protein [Lachnospiraceae bacterium]|nr:Gx transporter family protein [Lachnospiraceae bacterium]
MKDYDNKSKNKKSNNTHSSSRLVALCGVLIALAMVLSYLESLVPLSFAIPGIKLGLANIVTIVALIKLGLKPALIISVGRVLLSGLLFGNPATIIYSMVGALLSIAVMFIVRKLKLLAITGTSVCGAVAHNLGQLIVAAVVIENTKIFYYMAVLSLSGIIAGILIGILAGFVVKNIHL